MSKRLGIFVTHPIQYFAPLWRELAGTSGLDVVVHFFSDHSVRGAVDPEFGVPVAWDIPLLEGYEHTFLSRNADLSKPRTVRLPHARETLRAGAFDTVMVHGYMHAFERHVVSAPRDRGVKTLLRGELTDAQPFEGRTRLKAWLRDRYLATFYRKIDTFCYIGKEAQWHLQRRGIPAERMFFSPYSVAPALCADENTNAREQARAEFGFDDAQTVLLFSGKLIPRKAPLLLIEALRKLDAAGNLALIVLGDGQLHGRIEAEARQLLGSRLVMPGFVNQSRLGKYFAAADAFVLPSAFETWGLVVNEAMQFGLPAIVSDRVGCRHDLVVEGVTGHVFRSGDADALAASLRPLLGTRASIRRMGSNARRRVADYNIQASAEGIRRAVGLG